MSFLLHTYNENKKSPSRFLGKGFLRILRITSNYIIPPLPLPMPGSIGGIGGSFSGISVTVD